MSLLLLNAIEADIQHILKHSQIELGGITANEIYLFDTRPTSDGIRVVFNIYDKAYDTLYANFKVVYGDGRLHYTFLYGSVEANRIAYDITWFDGCLRLKDGW